MVNVVHIFKDGHVIISKKKLQQFVDNFNWVKQNEIDKLIQSLKPRTDSHRKSIIAIFEKGESINYSNVSSNFTNCNLLNKSGINRGYCFSEFKDDSSDPKIVCSLGEYCASI